MINNRNYWTQIGRAGTIWIFHYGTSKKWDWAIGLLKKDYLSSLVGIILTHEAARPAACPTSATRFQYTKGEEFPYAPANSVLIQCV